MDKAPENKAVCQIVSLRAFAAMSVVLLHVVSGWTSGGVILGVRWLLDEVVIQILVRWAVPCFIMISGGLLLNPEKDMPHEHVTFVGRLGEYKYYSIDQIVDKMLNMKL